MKQSVLENDKSFLEKSSEREDIPIIWFGSNDFNSDEAKFKDYFNEGVRTWYGVQTESTCDYDFRMARLNIFSVVPVLLGASTMAVNKYVIDLKKHVSALSDWHVLPKTSKKVLSKEAVALEVLAVSDACLNHLVDYCGQDSMPKLDGNQAIERNRIIIRDVLREAEAKTYFGKWELINRAKTDLEEIANVFKQQYENSYFFSDNIDKLLRLNSNSENVAYMKAARFLNERVLTQEVIDKKKVNTEDLILLHGMI